MDRLLCASQVDTIEKNYAQDSLTGPWGGKGGGATADLIESDEPQTSKDSLLLVALKKAEYVGDYKLSLTFSDGYEHVVDFGPFLLASANPLIRKYLNLEEFKDFTVQYGDLFWKDYDLCFPIADLYHGTIE
ncbi:MAG: DUF2442 domain-containing protein [Ardenticatenaceae bacterium]